MPAPTLRDYRAVRERRFGRAELDPGVGERPKVTIITVALDARRTLARTIESVQAQSCQDLEHVVVDGGSTDGTQELLRTALRPRDYWISEPDDGISDAFNKGIALAAGDYLQFVNADDWLAPEQVAVALATLEADAADFVFGDLIFYRNGRADFRYAGDPRYRKSIRRRMPALNHPTALIRRAAFERIGLFDPRYRCAMDYDWFLRLHLAGGGGVHLPELVGHMNHDGISNLDYPRTYREVEAIAVAHGRHPGVARVETQGRLIKTRIGREVRGRAQPLYHFLRARLNRSYASLGSADPATRGRRGAS